MAGRFHICILVGLLMLSANLLKGGDVPATRVAASQPVVDEKTQHVIDGALKFIASKQAADGRWDIDKEHTHSVALTAYAVMAYLAAGQVPEQGEYGNVIVSAKNFLLSCVQEDGYIADTLPAAKSGMYEHGIATIALAELYGHTKDAAVKEKLTLAVQLIVKTQNAAGGWRYAPRVADADISVTVFQCEALEAARRVGLDVPKETFTKAMDYVLSCYNQPTGGFSYQPGSSPGSARTAAGVAALESCGQLGDKHTKSALKYLISQNNPKSFFTYGVYHAGPAFYMAGGDDWAEWYQKMNGMLVASAKWNANKDMCDWAGLFDSGGGVGQVYADAVYTTVLALPLDHIRLYQKQFAGS